MIEKLCSMKSVSIVASSAIMFLSLSTVHAAGPVAVSPLNKQEVVVANDPAAPVVFTMGIGAGYLTGESNEIVYWPQENNHKASELTWKIDSLFMVGVSASFEVNDWFIANFDGWFKATDGDGTMDDYDWMVVGGDWTDWSHHEDTDVTDGSIIDLNANFAFYQSGSVRFTGIVGYKRDSFGWDSRGGDYTYSVNGFRDSTGSFEDGALAISYEQTLESLYGGLGFDANFSGVFRLSGRVIYSPFVQGEATDNHYFRNLVTYDDFEEGDMIAFDLAGTYFFNDNLGLEVMFSHQSYDTMQGDSEWQFRGEGVVFKVNDGAGMDHSSTMISTALQYRF